VVAVIYVVTKKEDPVTAAKSKIMHAMSSVYRHGAAAPPMAARKASATDWDATASMWADEDAVYRRASAMDNKY